VVAMDTAPYIVFAIVVALFVALVWRMRAPRARDDRDAAEIALEQRDPDRMVTGIADLKGEMRVRRIQAEERARRPPPRP
jgi:hypothetical protein